MNNAVTPESAKIRRLNDLLRKELVGGKIVFAGRLASNRDAAGIALQHRVLTAVRLAEVDPDNDPYGEGDFGNVTIQGQNFYWKIDYYDLDLEFASEDPADPERTTRVMSIFYAEDY